MPKKEKEKTVVVKKCEKSDESDDSVSSVSSGTDEKLKTESDLDLQNVEATRKMPFGAPNRDSEDSLSLSLGPKK